MFEEGIALFNSDGNQDYTDASSNDCSMSSPSTGIGVFGVSAYKIDDDPNPDELLMDSASRGGTSTEGPTGHTLRAEEDVALNPQYSTGRFGHSSGATPAVTGAAALFRQWYIDTQGSAIDDPGLLYTALLMMGDRSTQSGFLTTGFDNLHGAGKLRLRMLDLGGTDSPAGWALGSACVDDGTSTYIDIGGGLQLTGAMDYIHAVIWWYDKSHDDYGGNDFDKVDLYLERKSTQYGAWSTSMSNTDDDNKQMVFKGSDVPNYWYRLRLSGRDVASDLSGCGTNSNRIYYGWIYEDNARNDDADLTTYVRPEEW